MNPDRLKPGEALARTLRENAQRRTSAFTSRANAAIEKRLVLGGDLTSEELVDVQPRLRREFYERQGRRA
jgi:hypothetical protein